MNIVEKLRKYIRDHIPGAMAGLILNWSVTGLVLLIAILGSTLSKFPQYVVVQEYVKELKAGTGVAYLALNGREFTYRDYETTATPSPTGGQGFLLKSEISETVKGDRFHRLVLRCKKADGRLIKVPWKRLHYLNEDSSNASASLPVIEQHNNGGKYLPVRKGELSLLYVIEKGHTLAKPRPDTCKLYEEIDSQDSEVFVRVPSLTTITRKDLFSLSVAFMLFIAVLLLLAILWFWNSREKVVSSQIVAD